MSGFAAAADMAVKAVAPAPYLYDWSGIYVGGVVGGAWGTHDLSNTGLGIVGTILGSPVVQTNKPSAFIGDTCDAGFSTTTGFGGSTICTTVS